MSAKREKRPSQVTVPKAGWKAKGIDPATNFPIYRVFLNSQYGGKESTYAAALRWMRRNQKRREHYAADI